MIVFARHGNTFEAGQPAVWVGARTDLPLTSEGLNQAARVVDYLKQNDVAPKTVIAGPLRRTREFAGVVAEAFGRELEIDEGLVELDYGKWEGLDNRTVTEQFGQEALSAWEQSLIWPSAADWGESREAVEKRLRDVLARVSERDQPVFVCTSNGILRVFRYLIDGTEGPTGKVKTGAICVLDRNERRSSLDIWDYRPSPAQVRFA